MFSKNRIRLPLLRQLCWLKVVKDNSSAVRCCVQNPGRFISDERPKVSPDDFFSRYKSIAQQRSSNAESLEPKYSQLLDKNVREALEINILDENNRNLTRITAPKQTKQLDVITENIATCRSLVIKLINVPYNATYHEISEFLKGNF